jgi:putative lipoprotein
MTSHRPIPRATPELRAIARRARSRRLCCVVGAAALAGTLSGPAAFAQSQPDSWTGSDKALHLGLSAPFGMIGASVASREAGTVERVAVGTLIGSLPGLAKELADTQRPGATPSMKDMTYNLLGAALGAAVGDCCLLRPVVRGDRVDGVGVEIRVDF